MFLKKSVYAIALAAPLALFANAGKAEANSFDGSQNLICFALDTVHCASDDVCLEGRAADLNLPQFLRVDFTEMLVRRRTGEDTERSSKIGSVSKSDDSLVLQGAEEGLGWTLLVEKNSEMTVTASGSGEAFAIFGACTPD